MKTRPRFCPYCHGISRKAGLGLFECRSCRRKFRPGQKPPTERSEHRRYCPEFRDRGVQNPFAAMDLVMLTRPK